MSDAQWSVVSGKRKITGKCALRRGTTVAGLFGPVGAGRSTLNTSSSDNQIKWWNMRVQCHISWHSLSWDPNHSGSSAIYICDNILSAPEWKMQLLERRTQPFRCVRALTSARRWKVRQQEQDRWLMWISLKQQVTFLSYLFTETANGSSAVTCRVRLPWVYRVRRHITSWLGGVISWNPPGAKLTSLWQCFHFHQTNTRVLTF